MNRIIITVGTSLLASACWDIDGIDSYDGIDNDVEKREVELRNRQVISRIQQEELFDRFRGNIWTDGAPLRDLPAELATLKKLVEALDAEEERDSLGRDDQIVLIHSGNSDGCFCANILEKMIQQVLPDISVRCLEIRYLDPARAADLQYGLETIWKEVVCLLTDRNALHTYLNLTGGYKVTAMLLAALSMCYLKGKNITIVYGHETADFSSDVLFALKFDNSRGDICERVKFGFFTEGDDTDFYNDRDPFI